MKQNKNEHKLSFREAEFAVDTRKDGELEVKELKVSVSSEVPYFRGEIWDSESKSWVPGYEVLGHEASEVDFGRMKDGLVIQDTHWGDQVGLMKDIEIKDGKLTGSIIFGCGERSQEIKKDAEAGIRRNMSVGYRILEITKVGKAEDGYPIFRATKWQPYEASFVNVPADTNVGVERSIDIHNGEEGSSTAEIKEQTNMDPVVTPPAVGVTANEVREIVKEGLESIRAEIAKKPEMPATRVAPFDESETRTIEKSYNILNVIRALAGEKNVDVGFERECSEQIGKVTGKSARGFFIPDVALRVVTGKTNVANAVVGAGANIVDKTIMHENFIDALVAKTVLGGLGVQTLSGLVGDIALPKASALSAGWITNEDTAAGNVNTTFAQVQGTPHTIAANTVLSRKLMLQTSGSVQAIVTKLLIESLARGIEAAAFDGAGTAGAPLGLSATTGVGSVTMTAGAPKKENLVAFWETVLGNNAAGSFAFVGSPAVKAALCKVLDYFGIDKTGAKATADVVAGIGGGYLCSKDSKVEGYDYVMSGLCHSKKLYFGAWNELMLAFWSGIDLTVDPYTFSSKGAVQLTAFQDCDVLVRNPGAFAIGTVLS